MPEKHFQTPKIIEPGERHPLLLLLLVLSLMAMVGWYAYDFGQRRGGYFAHKSEAQKVQLKQQLKSLGEECDKQRELAARYQRASQIDRLAAEQVREEMKTLQQERSDLRKKVAFLDSLISGEVAALQVSQVELERRGDGNTYGFSFMISKRAKDDVRVTGKVDLKVSGKLQGKQTTLTPEKLGLNDVLKMGFRHFQKFEGTLKLPDGFDPGELIVVGQPEGKKIKRFEQRIKWQLG